MRREERVIMKDTKHGTNWDSPTGSGRVVLAMRRPTERSTTTVRAAGSRGGETTARTGRGHGPCRSARPLSVCHDNLNDMMTY